MLRKFVIGSLVVHLLGLAVAVAAQFSSPTQPREPSLNLKKMESITAATKEEIAKSVAVSEAELAASMSTYKQRIAENAEREELSAQKVKQANADLKEREQQIGAKEMQIKKMERQIAELEKKAKELKKEEDKKKRNELERQRKENEKRQLEEKKKKEVERKKMIEKQAEENRRALKELEKKNKEARARELASIREKYESTVHDLLYSAWILPYERTNVSCSVELSLSDSGGVLSHRFINDCPDSYKYMIDLAIERTPRLPRVTSEIFRKTEIINFIDNVR